MSFPRTKDRYVGIEFEFITNHGAGVREKFSKLLSSKATLGDDGSIEYDSFDEDGWELRLCVKASELKQSLSIVNQFLMSVKARVNDSCGLHVHLDMRNFNVVKAFENLMNKQDQMIKSLPMSRKDNTYCKKLFKRESANLIASLKFDTIKKKTITDGLKKITGLSGFDFDYIAADVIERIQYDLIEPSHYDGISIDPYVSGKQKTIEVRFHEGTVDCDSVYNWYMYLSGIAYRNTVSKTSNKYIKARIKAHG